MKKRLKYSIIGGFIGFAISCIAIYLQLFSSWNDILGLEYFFEFTTPIYALFSIGLMQDNAGPNTFITKAAGWTIVTHPIFFMAYGLIIGFYIGRSKDNPY